MKANPQSFRRCLAWLVLLMPMALVFIAAPAARAAPTEEEILRSFNENMDQTPDYGRLIPWAFALAGAVAVVIYFRQWQKRQAVPKALNSPRKLIKEVANAIEFDPTEMKKLTQRAKELNCDNPLTLLLCPSLLGEDQATEAVGEAQ